jgi:UDP-N-acetylmuramate-alanine ligase
VSLAHRPRDIDQTLEAARKALVEKPELAKKIVEAIMAKRAAAVPEK